jgi:hypothetical protein
VGTHPHYAHTELDIAVEEIVRLSAHPKIVAIGEAGLDYFYDNSPREAQMQGFRNHIAAAQETGLPLVIHARDADDDIATTLEREMAKRPFPAVLHCFTGGPDLARRALDLGLYISFSGILTFKKSDALREIAASRSPGTAAGGDGRALPGARQVSRQAQRAGLCRVHGSRARQRQGHLAGRAGAGHHRQLLPALCQDAAGSARRMSTRFTILGCGSSGGVPRIGNIWGNCDPANPKNRRRRCALLVERFGKGKGGTTTVLVDTPPDIREQLLGVRVVTLDGVLFTHDHADHTHGIDDLRGVFFNARRRIDVYADARTRATLMQRFDYCFVQPPGSAYPAILTAHDIAPPEPVRIDGQAAPSRRGRSCRSTATCPHWASVSATSPTRRT